MDSEMLTALIAQMSVYNLVVLTLDRYVHIMHPLWSRKYITSKMKNIALVIPWILGPLINIPLYINFKEVDGNKCIHLITPERKALVTIIVILFNFVAPLLVFIFCYARMLNKMRKRWPAVNDTGKVAIIHLSILFYIFS